MSNRWPEKEPQQHPPRGNAIGWTPSGYPIQQLPWCLPVPKTFIVTQQALYIDGWIFFVKNESSWVQWLMLTIIRWASKDLDQATRTQCLGIVEALETILMRPYQRQTDTPDTDKGSGP